MSRSIAKVTLLGNLTRDPELRSLPSGTAVCSFSVAVSRSFKDKEGNWQEETSYFDCQAWASQAENASKYLKKGSKVFVEGRLVQRRWEQDGNNRSKVEISVNELIFLTPKENDTQPQSENYNEKSVSELQKEVGTNTDDEINLDDIPF